MELLSDKYEAQMHGVLNCYDRIVIAGHLQPLSYAKGMTNLADGQVEERNTPAAIRESFGSCINALEELHRKYANWEENLLGWLSYAALASIYYYFGFFEAGQAEYDAAIRSYTLSLMPYRDLKFEISQARSLNDRGYVLALVGDAREAEGSVKDGLRLRHRLGFGHPIALSLNTLGIVVTLGELPERGDYYSERALQIFRRLDDQYGQMLAHRALSEAHRRRAVQTPLIPRQRERLLMAEEASKEATGLALKLLPLPSHRRSDILNEFGCVYRDLARFCRQNPEVCEGEDNANSYDAKAEKLFQDALDAVEKLDAADCCVDAKINLAYLYFWRIDSLPPLPIERETQTENGVHLQMAEAVVSEAIDLVPTKFRDLDHADHNSAADQYSGFWAFLGKIHALGAQIERKWLDMAEAGAEMLPTDDAVERDHETALLRHVIYVLYYANRLQGNHHQSRLADQVTRDVLRSYNSAMLQYIYDNGVTLLENPRQGAWKEADDLLRHKLRASFGIGYSS